MFAGCVLTFCCCFIEFGLLLVVGCIGLWVMFACLLGLGDLWRIKLNLFNSNVS